MSKVSRLCNFCNEPYQADTRELARGNGIFCSRTCSSRNRAANMPPPVPNAICAYCQVRFHLSPSKMSASRSGLLFCCREHKDAAQRIGGLVAIQPPHYGTGVNYRDIAFRAMPAKCARCGYDRHPEILEVNHIDCDRSNNELGNLEILCPNCHAEYHFETRTGKWAKREAHHSVVEAALSTRALPALAAAYWPMRAPVTAAVSSNVGGCPGVTGVRDH